MITRYHITVGANTDAGGKVISSNSIRWLNDVQMAYAGDPVSCPKCNSTGVIQPDGPRLSDVFDGRQVALSDDICVCKCKPPPRLIADQDFSFQTIDADWHAAKAGEVAATAAKLNTAGSSAPRMVQNLFSGSATNPFPRHLPAAPLLHGACLERIQRLP